MSNYGEDLTLEGLRHELSEQQPNNPYETFFLLRNPFPAAGQLMADICVDQDTVKSSFARALREFYLDGKTKRVVILGRTGAGKTTLLRFFERKIHEWRSPSPGTRAIADLFSIYIREPKGGYFEIHRQVVSQLGALFYTRFFEAVHERKIDLHRLPTELTGINPDLIRALLQTSSHRSLFEGGPSTEALRALDNWLQGVKLTPAERRQIGNVTTEISRSPTTAIKLLADVFRIFLHGSLFRGVIILFDEFEEIVSGLSATAQAQYVQDLRNLLDSIAEGAVFVIASVPVSEKLTVISPALGRRLGEGVLIEPVQDEASALEYAQAYIDWGRKAFAEQCNSEFVLPAGWDDLDRPFYPLRQTEIIDIYGRLRQAQGTVVPGDLLPELNLKMYRRAYEGLR
jgi:energy-coupling factor transporter ATP-binding protein EcfA2